MRSRQHGFSLLETMVSVLIMGLTAAWGVSKLRTFHQMRKLDGEARALYSVIAEARAKVLKTDLAYLIKFDAANNRYMIYQDNDGDKVADAGELQRTTTLASLTAFGAPTGGPSSGPGGTGTPSAKVEGNWTTLLILDRDRAVTINTGTLYVCAPSIKNRTYCIKMPSGTRQLELWRWDGTGWKSI